MLSCATSFLLELLQEYIKEHMVVNGENSMH